jgi:hypothetical protein
MAKESPSHANELSLRTAFGRSLKKVGGKVRVELAFRLASNLNVFDPEPALAGGSNFLARLFQQPVRAERNLIFLIHRHLA